jgi:hypothetical protein
VESVLCEAGKIGAQQRLVLARAVRFGCRHPVRPSRAVVCAAQGQPLHMSRRSLAIS